nr:NYN domain-containing protein [Cereibacter sphaeroides f. sp. denitrificans]
MSISIFPEGWLDADGRYSAERRLAHDRGTNALVQQIINARDVTYKNRKVTTLVDVQGIYLGLLEFFRVNEIPVRNDHLLSRFAVQLICAVQEDVAQRERDDLGVQGVDYEKLWTICERRDEAKLRSISVIRHITHTTELFFAPSPLSEICRKAKFLSKDDKIRQLIIDNATQGLAVTQWGTRNYRFYDDFVGSLATLLEAKSSERGFFGVHVKDALLRLDEKEVDIRLAVRAMDVMAGAEADALLIVSSDQDYMPLHQRCRDAGLRTYHSDVANFFRVGKTGRKIKDLGDHFILADFSRGFFWLLINEYQQGYLPLSAQEYSALWTLHQRSGYDPNR